jgi:class 3 adenylate cyclase
MPEVNGLEMCVQVRAQEKFSELPIIVVTSHDDAEHHTLALNAGADDFVPKPVHPPVLLRRLANVVSRRRVEVENRRLVAELSGYVSNAARVQASEGRTVARHQSTILFSDLRGFTTATEHEALEPLFESVNVILTRQTEIIRRWGGDVDKFAGDGMMAVFEQEDGAYRACMAALDIVKWGRETKEVVLWKPLPVALGVDYGEVIRGDIGTKERREYSLVGTVVNRASRLCDQAHALEVVISDAVAGQLDGRLPLSKERLVKLKGFGDSQTVFVLS